MNDKKIDWVKLRTEYVSGNISIAKLAEKHNISKSALSKRASFGHWSDAKKEYQEKASEKTVERLNNQKVRETVRSIDKVINAADKLMKKIDKAIDEVDKTQILNKKSSKMKIVDGLVSTQKISDLSKSLVRLKNVLEDSGADDYNYVNVIEIPTMAVLQPPSDEGESDE